MKSISGKQLCKIVEQKGWVLQRITGRLMTGNLTLATQTLLLRLWRAIAMVLY